MNIRNFQSSCEQNMVERIGREDGLRNKEWAKSKEGEMVAGIVILRSKDTTS